MDEINKFDAPRNGKEYLADGDVGGLPPEDVHSAAPDVDDMLVTMRTQGLDVLSDVDPHLPFPLETRFAKETEEEVELDLTPGAPEADSDPVRVYLREMGASPLLTREGEVEIAKRIERGQLSMLKALSRSPIVIHQVLTLGDDLKRGVRSIKEIVVFDEEEVTEEILQARVDEITRRIDQLQKHYKTACRLAERLAELPEKKKGRQYRRIRRELGREIIRMSQLIRDLGLNHAERRRLTERVNKTVEIMRTLDRQLTTVETKMASARGEQLRK